MKTRRIVAAAIAAVASLSLVACGSQSYTPLTQANFAKAISDASKDVKSVHMSMKASSRLSINADFSYKKPAAMQMTMTLNVSGATSNVSLRLIGNTIYLQVPPATPAGKWVKADASALGAGSAQSYTDLGPQGMASQFKKGVKSIKYQGVSKINGQTVQHYTVVADASQLGTSLKALAAQVPSLANVTTIAEQIYLSDANVLQRMTITLPAPVGTMQVDFTNWNAPVTVQAPPTSAIVSSSGS
jgi:hypothetical protein